MNINVGVISLGCPKNLVDTEIVLGNLSKTGYKITNDPKVSDVIIINTCGFIDSAKQESINTIIEMAEYKKSGKCRALIVIGCLAKRYKDEIYREIPEVDSVLAMNEYESLSEIIDQHVNFNSTGKRAKLEPENYLLRMRTTGSHMAYLRISDGCDNCCTYCAIPSIRGRYISRTIESILEEANLLAKQGVKELIVVAQDTTKYGKDLYGKSKIVELLKELCKIDGFIWIRLLYAYPDSVTDELIDLMASEEKICRYIDLPIQHISDSILKRMGRRCTSQEIIKVIEKLRKKIPDIVIRTSIIVGFPGETEEDFEKIVEIVQTIKFDKLGVFSYSKEEGTPAAKFPDQIPYQVKTKRRSIIMKLQRGISKEINVSCIGRSLDVLIEGQSDLNSYYGRSYKDAPDIDGIVKVKTKAKKIKIGSVQKVRIIDAGEYDLIGEIEENESSK
jgi:ribosomal protein S12 methylthiotransferase